MTLFTHSSNSPVTVNVSLDATLNTLWAMSMLHGDTEQLQSEPWLLETAAQLTSEQMETNHLVFTAFGEALFPAEPTADFPTYLAQLKQSAPIDLVTRLTHPVQELAEPLVARVEQLLADPPALQTLLHTHLTMLWEQWFARPWQKKLYFMSTVSPNLQSRPWPTQSAGVAIRAFLRRALPDQIGERLGGIKHVIFVPSPYMQLQAARFGREETIRIFVYADPWVLPMRYEPIQRSEVLRTLTALTDETRLQILERLAVDETVQAPALIELLGVSQPTISRHLKLLKNSKWITEQRSGIDASKLYRLNHEQIGAFAHQLQTLLSADNAQVVLQDMRGGISETLRPFLNRDGLVLKWPSKKKPQQEVLRYIIEKVAIDQEYSEREITDLIGRWLFRGDPVHLRRELIDFKYLVRTANGSRYWRETNQD